LLGIADFQLAAETLRVVVTSRGGFAVSNDREPSETSTASSE
jgi:hypothetical protein